MFFICKEGKECTHFLTINQSKFLLFLFHGGQKISKKISKLSRLKAVNVSAGFFLRTTVRMQSYFNERINQKKSYNAKYIFPYIAEEVNSSPNHTASRYIINVNEL